MASTSGRVVRGLKGEGEDETLLRADARLGLTVHGLHRAPHECQAQSAVEAALAAGGVGPPEAIEYSGNLVFAQIAAGACLLGAIVGVLS